MSARSVDFRFSFRADASDAAFRGRGSAGSGARPGGLMALRITVDIFSGRPNPVVTVAGDEE
ncbi:MAG: hypothetical protein KC645_03595, partial [Gemmatimonadetes bacterium]|nr:hypothetical protein [Gemmatimonadota bacterium]